MSLIYSLQLLKVWSLNGKILIIVRTYIGIGCQLKMICCCRIGKWGISDISTESPYFSEQINQLFLTQLNLFLYEEITKLAHLITQVVISKVPSSFKAKYIFGKAKAYQVFSKWQI